jgi:hypothetical protein
VSASLFPSPETKVILFPSGDHVGREEETLVIGQLRRKELERDSALQAQVLRQIDDPHPATAEHLFDPITEEFAFEPKFI